MKTPKAMFLTTGFLSVACVLFGVGAKPKYFPPPGETPAVNTTGNTDKKTDLDSKKYFPQVAEAKNNVSSIPATPPQKTVSSKTFPGLVVYADDKPNENRYAPTGWMGDFGGLKMDTDWAVKPHAGMNCVRFTYKPSGGSGNKWVSVYWQDPPNNWGEKDGGYDLTGAQRLTFWARGEKGGEIIKEVRVGGIKGNYSDSDLIISGPITLDSIWKQFSVSLKGLDLTAISGGFYWMTDTANNPEGLTFYMDDIRFE